MNNDEQDIHDVMTSLLDRIDRELNPSSETDTCMLFDASSNLQRQLSRPSGETLLPITVDEFQSSESFQMSSDLSQPLEEYKHSIGILLGDDQEPYQNSQRIPSGKKIPIYQFEIASYLNIDLTEVSYVFDWGRFKRAVKIKSR